MLLHTSINTYHTDISIKKKKKRKSERFTLPKCNIPLSQQLQNPFYMGKFHKSQHIPINFLIPLKLLTPVKAVQFENCQPVIGSTGWCWFKMSFFHILVYVTPVLHCKWKWIYDLKKKANGSVGSFSIMKRVESKADEATPSMWALHGCSFCRSVIFL